MKKKRKKNNKCNLNERFFKIDFKKMHNFIVISDFLVNISKNS